MKTRNVKLENSTLLTNHICKHVVLEAPTALELEKKIKNYKLTLTKAITNAYRISSLTLQNDCSYHISPTGNYQVRLFINFEGKKKAEIANPEKTLQYLKQLTSLTSKKHQEAHLIKNPNTTRIKALHNETMIIEVEHEDQTDEVISIKQKELFERLVTTTDLTSISFFTKFKGKDPETGKIIMSISVQYKCMEKPNKDVPQSPPEEPGNR